MRLILKYSWLLTIIVSLSSCEKYNYIDNAGTVKTPYTLFIGGYHGTLHKTNDGLYYNTLFYTDNSVVRQVLVADTNVLFLKKHFYCSQDEGRFFDRSNDHALPFIDSFYKYFYPNQAIYDFTNKKVYLTTKAGLEVSTDFGKTFTPEIDWITAAPGPTDTITSITQLKNGTCYLMIDSEKQYKKLVGQGWQIVNQNSRLPRDTTWYIAHAGDTLFAIDFFGKRGVYYSTNVGVDWAACSGMPKSRKILFGNQAAGSGGFYIGYDSAGLYRLNGTTFVNVGKGIPWYAKVGYVEGKDIKYRTDVIKNYLYCSTDVGLYWSKNGGTDWDLVRHGTFSTLE